MRTWTSTFLLLWSAVPAWTQPEIRFQHLTTQDGLSDNAITCILEDRAGYIWIGTEHGLNRYDGQRVERIDSTSNLITAVAQGGNGVIWFTTLEEGLGRVEPSTGRITRFQHDPKDPKSLPTNELNHVFVVDEDLLVLSSRSQGAIWFDVPDQRFTKRGYVQPVLDANGDTTRHAHQTWCHGVFRIDEHRLWLSMIRGGPVIVDARTGELLRNVAECDPPVGLTHAVRDGDHLVAGGWNTGLQRVPLTNEGPSTCVPLDEEVTAILPWERTELLVGTKLHGIVRLTKDGHELQRFRHDRRDASSLGNDHVRCMMRDRAGNLWVGTAAGLSVHAPSVWRFEAIPLLDEQVPGDLVAYRIDQERDGIIRVSASAGFFLVDPHHRSVQNVPLGDGAKQLDATGLFTVAPNVSYLGTETGLYRYDKENERIMLRSPDTWPVGYHAGSMFQVRSAHADSLEQGRVLVIAALGFGQIVVDAASGRSIEALPGYPTGLPAAFLVRDAERDARGAYWSATATSLMRWLPSRSDRPAEFTSWSPEAVGEWKLPGRDLMDILLRHDTTWIAMRDAGLACIVNDRAEPFVPPSHIPHDLLGVTIDGKGHVWGTTTNGLVRFDPSNNTWLRVPVNDGRRFNQLSGCIITLADGRIACYADNHLLLFDPATFDDPAPLPEPSLAWVGNTWGALAPDEHAAIEVTYRSSAFDAALTALRPVGPGHLLFVYRLEGIDAKPRVTSSREPLRYAGVPPGTHRLLVRVRDELGREGPERALLTITVIGPIWQRWWFFLLVLGAGALGMYLISRFRQKQRLKLQGVRDRIARDLHDDIGSTLGSINFYSEALKRKLENTSDGLVQEVAEKIGSSSREMVDQMSDIVWSVDPKHDKADALITRLQAFAGDLLATRNIALHFSADPALKDRKLTAEQRRNLFLIGKETLYNALKYADARTVRISFRGDNRTFTMELQDDGRGFDPGNTDSYNGHGLPNMRNRAAAIDAQFILESSPGNGTRVRVVVTQKATPPHSWD